MDDVGHFCGALSSAYPLYNHAQEDAFHFIAVCSQLHSAHLTFLASTPPGLVFCMPFLIVRFSMMWSLRFVGFLIFLYRLILFNFFGSSVPYSSYNVISSSPVGIGPLGFFLGRACLYSLLSPGHFDAYSGQFS